VFTPPTIASGITEYRELDQQRTRRVAVVHAGGNTIVGLLYLYSWVARRRGKHARGVMLSTLGALGAWSTGYLGGHLSFARGAGMGERGVINLTSADALAAQDDNAAGINTTTDSEPHYEVGSLNDDELEYYYRTVVGLKHNGENRSIQGIMRELGQSGPQNELRLLDALQTLGNRGRLELVPTTAEWSAHGNEVNETNETHWYEPVD
jgi:hypothetical protein